MSIWSDGWFIDGEKAYFIGGECQILFCVNLKNRKIKAVSVLPVENVFSYRGHNRCFKYNDVIYCLPDLEDNILVYNIKKGTWTTIDVTSDSYIRLSMGCILENNDSIFFASDYLGKIIEVNKESVQAKAGYHINLEEKEITSSGCEVNADFYMVSDKNIYYFDCINKTQGKTSISLKEDYPIKVTADRDSIWITGEKKKLYRISLSDIRKNITHINYEVIAIEVKDVPGRSVACTGTTAFSELRIINSSIWLMPAFSNRICKYNIFNGDISYIEIKEDTPNYNISGRIFQFYNLLYVRNNRYLGLYSFLSQSVLEIDTNEMTYEFIDFEFNDVEEGALMKDVVKKNRGNIMYETKDFFTLKNYLSHWV